MNRVCPKCKSVIFHKTERSCNVAIQQNRICKKCQLKNITDKTRHNALGFIADAIAVHGNRYDYHKSDYTTIGHPVEVICYKHGSFFQRPNHHLKGHGCPKCMADKIGNKFRSNLEEFISEAKRVHGDLYDYSKSAYNGRNHKVEIICPKHHKSFWQTAGSHLRGSGCPRCAWGLITSGGWLIDKGSVKFRDWLKSRGYNFQFQYHIPEIHVALDFYDPSSKVIIEYDSKYHRSKSQQAKDRLREKKIIGYLSPKEFWRIDEKSKTSRNILVA